MWLSTKTHNIDDYIKEKTLFCILKSRYHSKPVFTVIHVQGNHFFSADGINIKCSSSYNGNVAELTHFCIASKIQFEKGE